MARQEDRQSNVARSYSELLTKLRSQIGFLERSAEHFDAGNEDEGERLALAARVLLHDTGQSHSLLGQLGVKPRLLFTDTSLHSEPETRHLGGGKYAATATIHAGLVELRADLGPGQSGAWGYAPVLAPEKSSRQHPPVHFDPWWESPFLADTDGGSVTRKAVTLAVANKDGGAHVARAIPEAFRRLSSGTSMPFRNESEGSSSDIPGVVMATMRQIAFELLDTLQRELPQFISEAPIEEGAEFTVAEKSGIPRNEQCVCGSGKKFKACHGA